MPPCAEDDAGRDDPQRSVLDDCSDEGRLLREHAEQLGVTAEELTVALERLALQAEVVLHRLRGLPTH